MNRRTFAKAALLGLAGGASGLYALSTFFQSPPNPENNRGRLFASEEEARLTSPWTYSELNPEVAADATYMTFDEGGCMYGVFRGALLQLEKKFGDPYKSFPYHMMKYGGGGIGEYGSVCGALNAGGAVIGLFVGNKTSRESLINDLFFWYENTALPSYKPDEPKLKLDMTSSVSKSVLCHASITNWGKASGHKVNGERQKERCRRLASDVANKTISILNNFFDAKYITSDKSGETAGECLKCHGKSGKLSNTKGKMLCVSCHSESLGHSVFSNIHYRLLDSPQPK